MVQISSALRSRAFGFLVALVVIPFCIPVSHSPFTGVAAADEISEKEAFEAAKELGTADAWKAFLASYPTGFRADLARAYLAKVGQQSAQSASSEPPQENEFPIVAGSWGGLVRKGPGKEHDKVGSLDEGDEVTLMARTDVIDDGFPWFKIRYGDGSVGYQWGGILCATGAERPDIFKTCTKPVRATSSAASAKTKTSKSSSKGCSSGRIVVDGKCLTKSAAISYCGPGFKPKGGKCVSRYTKSGTSAPSAVRCPKGLVWNAQEGCHEDD